MVAWADNPAPTADTSISDLKKLLYRGDVPGLVDSMKLEVVHLRGREEEESANKILELINHAQNWQRPIFPLQGQDLIAAGMKPGPEMGQRLKALEQAWIDSGFDLGREELLAMVGQA
jgi:tRNA nucleotidyltransferase/poly(A) polymerase